MELNMVGIDLAKQVFQLHGVDRSGRVVLTKKLGRKQFTQFMSNLKPCTVAMEACGSAHHWGRKLQGMGFEVKLVAPHLVKPFVKSQKNDARDAEAIVEAASRPSMRFVPIKSQEQQDLLFLHRIRERLIRGRTALGNEIRGLLAEYGIVLPLSIPSIRKALPRLIDESEALSPRIKELLGRLYDELGRADEEVAVYDEKIHQVAKKSDICKRVMEVPGIGPITATALVASVGDPKHFKQGRQMAAWLGLVPRQFSSGGKTKLGGITKRGDTYLRKLLIHGARATVRWAPHTDSKRNQWINQLVERRGFNRAAVAVANKNVRIIWRLMATGEAYRPMKEAS